MSMIGIDRGNPSSRGTRNASAATPMPQTIVARTSSSRSVRLEYRQMLR